MLPLVSGYTNERWNIIRATAERPVRVCQDPFSYRFAALCIRVVAAGCALVERAGSLPPTA